MPSILKKWIRSCKECQLTRTGGLNPVQPSLFRRGAGRFSEVQLDFLGPISDSSDHSEPNNCTYLTILVDSATQMCMGCPAQSTSTSSVISAVLQWCAIFGPPSVLQLDSPPAHSSDKLSRFLTVLGIERSLGVSRRPQCQGRVENVIKEIKLAMSTNSILSPGRLPWWVIAQSVISVHNSSKIALYGFSPSELAFGIADPFLPSAALLDPQSDAEASSIDQFNDSWSEFRNQVVDNFYITRAIADDVAHKLEMVQLAHEVPLYTFSPGDQVRLCRLENNHRVLRGPFTVTDLHPSNPYLYRLSDWPGWVSLGQLLPFRQDSSLDDFTNAVHHHEAYTSGIFSLSLPDDVKIELHDAEPGNFVIIAEDDTTGPEPTRTLRIGEIDQKLPDGFKIIMLNKSARGSWTLPPTRDRVSFTWDVNFADVIGVFRPTRTRRLPPSLLSWLKTHGAL
ncbi:gag/pol/env polyprotein, putative [Perkinsus marinus ATCC 50983]|uniref:Gag/pol/env polyprotein, putative n=1 Tax=Perkinsus marinus (strain ATCC 50983 / TXsc) TaxID=423536 RepID=C5LLX8_PERM5|nr:gag/pol/env polyprotein, putative [Perkinsus marinus ATCC 50983]EER02350.1 gag/pol/env polyprotein, putative [Perkinsus marinus ATCC 50983]|eukprot:XP_002769632.1 gag/pol/env polyprotein, putative [Perkinsus marinus ATCC 50983]